MLEPKKDLGGDDAAGKTDKFVDKPGEKPEGKPGEKDDYIEKK